MKNLTIPEVYHHLYDRVGWRTPIEGDLDGLDYAEDLGAGHSVEICETSDAVWNVMVRVHSCDGSWARLDVHADNDVDGCRYYILSLETNDGALSR